MSLMSDIGIDDLPAPLGELRARQLYALSVPDAGLAEALTVCAARSALAAKRRVALVVRDPAATAVALARGGIDAVRAHRRDGLRLFAWTPQSSRAARLGPAQLLDELDAFGCGSDTLAWLCPAHDALRWEPPAALAGFARLYHGWARMCRSSLVLLFGEHGAGEGYAQLLAAHYPALAGLALIHGDRRDACWETRHWAGVDTAEGPSLLRLQSTAEGRLTCPPDLTAEAEHWRRRIIEAPDRDVVYVAAAAAHDAEPHWVVLADAAAIEHQAMDAVGATCLFAIGAAQELRPLAQRIHRLRRRCGRGVRLLVRECGYRLRHGQAQMLLTLGANAIIASGQRAAEVLAAHRERPFARPLTADFETALRSALPPTVGGQRDAAAFAEQARTLTLRAQEAGLACALLSFRLGAGVSTAEVRARCRPTRSGDLFCTETDTLHLFLYACWPEDIDKALRHILTGRVDALFDDEVRNTEPTLILAALDSLAARAVRAPLVDVAATTSPVSRPPRAVQPAPLQRRAHRA